MWRVTRVVCLVRWRLAKLWRQRSFQPEWARFGMNEANPYAPPRSGRPAPVDVYPMEADARRIGVWLWLYAVATAIGALSSAAYYASGAPMPGDETPIELIATLAAGVVSLIAFVVCAVRIGRFLYRSNLNARAFAVRQTRFSPGSMIWWFFVPIASLFKPYEAVRDVYAASFPQDTPPRPHPRMTQWWMAWVASHMLSQVAFHISDERTTLLVGITLIALPIDVMSAVLAMVIVRALAHRQDLTARQLRLGRTALG